MLVGALGLSGGLWESGLEARMDHSRILNDAVGQSEERFSRRFTL